MYHLVYDSIMNNTTQTRGRPKSFDEQEALTAAMHYFWQHGYDNTSLDELLVAMGIKKSSFYSTFKSKEEVFSRALRLYREKVLTQLRILQQKVGTKEMMLTVVRSSVEELRTTGHIKGCLVVNSGKECYGVHHKLSDQIGFEFNSMQDFFIEMVRDGQKSGEIPTTKTPEIIAGRFLNGLNGLATTIRAGASETFIDDIVKSLKEILE